MSVDFEKIPECVWQLFDEIMWADPDSRARATKPLSPNSRSHAYGICWGWDPPLMEPGSSRHLTQYGLAAWSWHKEQCKAGSEPSEPPLLEKVLDVLTEQQRKVVEYLWEKKSGASFDAIKTIPGAFRLGTSPNDDTIKDKIKKMNGRLQKKALPVSLEVSGRRVKVFRSPG